MPREEYVKPVKVTFGGRELIAPGCTDYYLTSLYGDYMKLPPEEDRKAHIIKMYQVESAYRYLYKEQSKRWTT